MGNRARDDNAYGPTARPASIRKPAAMTSAPVAMTEALKGNIGQAWTDAQTKAGGRWEVPAGAPAGAIGRNWVQPPAPVEPRQQLATIMAPKPDGIYRRGRFGTPDGMYRRGGGANSR